MRDFQETTRTKRDSVIFKRLLTYAGPYKKNFIIALLLMLIDVATSSISPLLVRMTMNVIDQPNSEVEKYWLIGGIILLFLIIVAIALVLTYVQNLLLQVAGQKIVHKLRSEVYEHIEVLSLGQFNQIPIGKLVTRVTNDTNTLSEMYTSVLTNLIRNMLMLVVQFVIMLVLNVQVTLIMGITLPFVAVLTFGYRRLARKQYRKVRNENSNMNAYLSENLSGVKLTQVFNQEEKKLAQFTVRNKRLKREHLIELSMFAIYRPLMFLISMAASLLVIYYMATDIILMPFSTVEEIATLVVAVNSMSAMYLYANDFYRPLQNLSEDFNILQAAFASAEKVFDVLDTKPEIINDPEAVDLVDFKGEIEFKNVWFYYIKDEWVLKDVSFKINPNDTVAFVGATGSGKTTIMNLIVRNYDTIKGQILIDGIDIKKINLDSLRREIGQMPQDVFLFTGTIKENITLADKTVSDEKIIKAAEYVGANTFIEKLPDSYDHIVRERGNNFSTGQRQLLSFARALVYEPTVMILDEATANIDSETEEIIQESLEKMMKISTMIVVAHRLSTIQKADKIYVMQKGEIKESGSHQELLNLGGIYYSLYELQYK
ncbi:MAG: ABC transporter ATP-binding protein [Acholeplasmataceae bacterium]|nr:ABC transporter ATP-binding protein [Acholeplasmataceae bacterium]